MLPLRKIRSVEMNANNKRMLAHAIGESKKRGVRPTSGRFLLASQLRGDREEGEGKRNRMSK